MEHTTSIDPRCRDEGRIIATHPGPHPCCAWRCGGLPWGLRHRGLVGGRATEKWKNPGGSQRMKKNMFCFSPH